MGWGNIGSALGSVGGSFGSALGGAIGSEFDDPNDRSNQQRYKHLKEGIQWRVADAQAAGVHPLAALGANIGSPLVQTTGSTVGDGIAASDSLGRGMARDANRVTNQKESARLNRATESSIQLNESQAMLNTARSRSIIAEM